MSKIELIKLVKNHCIIGAKESQGYTKKSDDYWSGKVTAYKNIVGFLNILEIGE